MHILAGRSGRIDQGDEAVDLGQSPADIVFLSAADTELASLASVAAMRGADGPSLRLANLMALSHPYSVDMYAGATVAGSRLVIVRLLGGAEYWPYGVDRLTEVARGEGLHLAILPGDDRWDEALAARSTLPLEAVERLWRYLAEGGAENLGNLLCYAHHLLDGAAEPDPPRALPRAGLFLPGRSRPTLAELKATWTDPAAPVAAIVFYRALMQGAATEPVEALCEALKTEGVNPLPVFVSSLKEAESAAVLAALFDEAPPAVVLNATAFAVGSAGRDHRPTPLDAPGAPVLQVVFSSSSEEGWRDADQGLSIRDLAMHVVMPEVDGRILTRAVSFKEQAPRDPLTQSSTMRFVPKPDRIAFVAQRDDGSVLLRTRPERGLLGGMSEVPTTGWTARFDGETTEKAAPFPANWRRAGQISHVFTHFSLELEVFLAKVSGGPVPDGHRWSPASTPAFCAGELARGATITNCCSLKPSWAPIPS